MFYLWINAAAGDYEISENPEPADGHLTMAGEFETYLLAAEEVHRRCESSKVWAVFYDNASNTGFVHQENDLSGNWKGSKWHPHRWIKSFKSFYAAEKFLSYLTADTEQTMAEKCRQSLREYGDGGNEWGDVIAGSDQWPLDETAMQAADPCGESDIAIFADGSRIAWHAGDQKWVVMP